MTYRRILVPFTGEPSGVAALQTALALARAFGAHAHVLHVRDEAEAYALHLRPVLSETGYEDLLVTARERAHERAERARAEYEAMLASAGLPERGGEPGEGASIGWELVEGSTMTIVCERGAGFDLIVVGRPSREATDPAREIAEAAVFNTGRPVLIAPPSAPETLGRRIVIGWNRSPQSGRAVTFALPLLERAEAVQVFSVQTGAKRGAPPASVVEHLAWHGVQAELVEIPPDYRVIGEALLDEAKQFEADLLVMGSFSHSRLRELILGGVTTHVLNNAELPVLTAH